VVEPCGTTGKSWSLICSPDRAIEQASSDALSGLGGLMPLFPVVTLRSPPANFRRPFRTKPGRPTCVDTNGARLPRVRPGQSDSAFPSDHLCGVRNFLQSRIGQQLGRNIGKERLHFPFIQAGQRPCLLASFVCRYQFCLQMNAHSLEKYTPVQKSALTGYSQRQALFYRRLFLVQVCQHFHTTARLFHLRIALVSDLQGFGRVPFPSEG
jgi:hypothetical protein